MRERYGRVVTTSAELLVDGFSRIHGIVHRTLDGLDEEQLTARLDPDANTIAWLVWHLTRVQDDHVADLAGTEQVWTKDGWADRFGFPFEPGTIGYGQSSADVAQVRGVSAEQLAGYHDGVHDASVRYVRGLADGPLFRGSVESVVVCAYGTPSAASTARPQRLVLTDGAARTVVDSLEKAPQTKPTGACPLLRTADAQAVALLGVSADGKVVDTVTTTVGDPACSVRVTNGTALRYRWLPPTVLRTALAQVNPSAGRSHGPVVQASPGNS
jgi:DinB superfamily